MAIVRNTIKFSSGGGSNITVVANYSALPDPTTVSGQFYAVTTSTGIPYVSALFGGNYKAKGIYLSDGTEWVYMGEIPMQATQSEVNTGTNNDKFVTPSTFENANKWTSKQDVLTDVNFGNFMDVGMSTKLTPSGSDSLLARDSITNEAVEVAISSILALKTRVLRQASDITRSDTTLVNTDMSFSVEANSIYHIQGWIIGGGNSSGGIRVSFSLPAGCSGSQSIAVSTNLVPNGIGSPTNAFAPGNNNQQSIYNGILITGSNAGTATLQFSSAVASQTGLFRTNSVFTINKQ